MTVKPYLRAFCIAASDSEPGCIQISRTPIWTHSSTIRSVTPGGTTVITISGTRGRSRKLLYNFLPDTSPPEGLVPWTFKPCFKRSRKIFEPIFSGWLDTPATAISLECRFFIRKTKEAFELPQNASFAYR